jgi:glycine reductase
MHPENPGVDLYRKDILCVRTGSSAAGTREAISSMAFIGLRLADGEKLGPPEEEGILPRGLRRNFRASRTGAVRAVDMLLDKLAGRSYRTELPMPVFEMVPPAHPVGDLSQARIALVTEGGIVPRGNPGWLESARATKYLKYDITGLDDLTGAEFQAVHGGYSNVFANEDPDRVLPVDALRECLKAGEIGSMADYFFTTTGNGTTLDNSRRFGREIAGALKEDGVDAVILTST